MMVYRFLDKVAGINTIESRRLRISRISNLNDPFEFLAADLSDRIFRRAFKRMKAALSKTRGIICFSENWQNPVLWGHYADRYRGICLAFDVSAELTKISYVKNRLKCAADGLDEALMKKIIFSKFEHWAYEEEQRLFCALNDQDSEGHYNVDFSEQVKLKRVMVGSESEVTRADISRALGDLSAEVDVVRVRPAFREFKVVENKNRELWR